MKNKTLRVIIFGGLGDALLTTPAFKALKEEDPGLKIILFCFNKGQQSVFKNNPYIHRVTSTSFLRNPITYIRYYLKQLNIVDVSYGHSLPSFFCKKNAKELIADLYGVKLKEQKIQIFLTEAEVRRGKDIMSKFKNPVIIHVTSRSSSNQDWGIDNWDDLVSQMPEYTFIQLGLKDEKRVKGAVDMRGATTFRGSMALVKFAKGFVGVDSSFSHVTNAFDIPGVVVFGPDLPLCWGQPNNINLYKSVRCSPCVEVIYAGRCPYGKHCMRIITVEEVKNTLQRQLSTGRAAISPQKSLEPKEIDLIIK